MSNNFNLKKHVIIYISNYLLMLLIAHKNRVIKKSTSSKFSQFAVKK